MNSSSRFFLRLCGALMSALLVTLSGCATVPAAGPGQVSGQVSTQPAPLLDRALFFDNPEVAGAQLSPDGAFISFLKPYQGVMNIWVKARTEPFASAKPLTASTRPVPGYFWSKDGKMVLFVQDSGGDEKFHLFSVDPKSTPAEQGVPLARDLTPGKLRAEPIAFPKKTPEFALVGLNDRDPAYHDVYRINLLTGAKALVRLNKDQVASWTADLDGQLRLATKTDAQGNTLVMRIDGDSLKPLTQCSVEEECSVLRFHKDGKRVYLESNAGANDLSRLLLLDVVTGKEEVVDVDPENQVDFGGAGFSEVTDELQATFYVGDRLRTYPKTEAFKRTFEAVRKAVPAGEISFGSSTRDEAFQLVAVDSDVDPGAVYLFERATGTASLQYRPRAKLNAENLAPMKPVRITARDGVVMTAYLTMPRGVTAAGPAIVLPHGGPWGRDTWGYNGQAQFLANRGYVVLQPNFRSSSGYGKKFLNLGNGQWGTGTMQHDLTDARAWLIQQGYADEKRIAIMGGSYGGYATLAGLAFTPDLYAAGVDIVGPSNLVTLLNAIPAYWASQKKMFAKRVADIDTREGVAQLEAQSPLNFAANIKAPLLVIQGANDPRVKQAEADQIVVALREKKFPVEYLVAADEGHGFRGVENRMAMYASVERFLGKHLGGRVQTEMPAEISAKLASLTVNVDTVKKPTAEVAKSAPIQFNGTSLKAATFRYQVAGAIQGQAMTGTSEVVVTKAKAPANAWTVTSTAKLPMGESKEMLTLDAKTLFLVNRNVNQGQVKVELSYSASGVKGIIQAGPQTMPVDVKSESPIAADNTVLGVLASTLPLALGFRVDVPQFEMQRGAVVNKKLAVVGEEKVTVPAGALDAWKLELKGEGTTDTLWIEKAGAHRLLKLTAQLPRGMGSLTQELSK